MDVKFDLVKGKVLRLSLKENDILVINVDQYLPYEAYSRIYDSVKKLLKKANIKNQVLILEKGVTPSIISEKKMNKLGWHRR